MNQSMLFTVEYKGPTNTRGSRMILKNHDLVMGKVVSKTFGFDYEEDDQNAAIINRLKKFGFKIIGFNSRYKGQCVILTKWDWELLTKFFKEGE